jgi:mono/diheme cytochrome c family protein
VNSALLLQLYSTAVLLLFSTGCVQEMANQPRVDPLEASTVFPNGMGSRQPVEGTIARGQLQLDEVFFTGRAGGQFMTELPAKATEGTTMSALLERGQVRFNAFCSQCHGQVGGGTGGDAQMQQLVGMVVKRGFPMPPTYHQERLRVAPAGYFFDVITNGFGRMPAHGYLVPPADRWAIVAYIRALQLSQHAEASRLSPEDTLKLGVATAKQ